MYKVWVIPEKGAPGLVLNTVYETLFPTDCHVMVAVVNVLELFTCTKCEGAAGDPVECLKRNKSHWLVSGYASLCMGKVSSKAPQLALFHNYICTLLLIQPYFTNG